LIAGLICVPCAAPGYSFEFREGRNSEILVKAAFTALLVAVVGGEADGAPVRKPPPRAQQ
jgi:hypothetical protein